MSDDHLNPNSRPVGWNVPTTSRSRSRSNSPKDDNAYLMSVGKYLLKDLVFYGHYQEKRRVDLLSSYRDLIVVSNGEEELKKKLDEFRKVFNDKYGRNRDTMWLGITNPQTIGAPNGYCVWTDLGHSLPFGEYNFQIRKVVVKENEVTLKLKKITLESSGQTGQHDSEPWESTQYRQEDIAKSCQELLEKWRTAFKDFMLQFLSIQINSANIFGFFRFMGLLGISLLTLAIQAVHFLGIFSIKFLEQLNNLLHVMTPFMMGVLELTSKIIGGFYILIAMIWKDSVNPGQRPQPFQAIAGPPRPGWRYPPSIRDVTYENIPSAGGNQRAPPYPSQGRSFGSEN